MFYRKIDQSCALVMGMAERLDRDLVSDIERNPEMQATVLRSAVMRCARCRQQGECQKLQAENARLDAAPSYCRNSWH